METRIKWLLVVMLVGVTTAAWIPHNDHPNRVIRQNVADESKKAGEKEEVELREKMTTTTPADASVVVEETKSIPMIEEVTLSSSSAVDTLGEEPRTLDDAKSEVQVSDKEPEQSTSTSAEQSADAEPVAEITPQVKENEEQLPTQRPEEEKDTEKQVINETFRKVQLKKVSAETEDVDAIESFHQPRSTTSPPPQTSAPKPTKLPSKLLDFLKNQLQTRKPTTERTITSTSTECLPSDTKNKPSSPAPVGAKTKIVSHTPGAGDEITPAANSPRISRARFFASASSLLSGFIPAVPPPEREGRAKNVNPIAYKSASVDELSTSTAFTPQSSSETPPAATASTSVPVKAPPRRKTKPPAPLPPVTTVKPESPRPKRSALSRLSQRLRVKPQSSTNSDKESTTPTTINISNVENTTKTNFLRKFTIRDMKAKLTHTKTA